MTATTFLSARTGADVRDIGVLDVERLEARVAVNPADAEARALLVTCTLCSRRSEHLLWLIDVEPARAVCTFASFMGHPASTIAEIKLRWIRAVRRRSYAREVCVNAARFLLTLDVACGERILLAGKRRRPDDAEWCALLDDYYFAHELVTVTAQRLGGEGAFDGEVAPTGTMAVAAMRNWFDWFRLSDPDAIAGLLNKLWNWSEAAGWPEARHCVGRALGLLGGQSGSPSHDNRGGIQLKEEVERELARVRRDLPERAASPPRSAARRGRCT